MSSSDNNYHKWILRIREDINPKEGLSMGTLQLPTDKSWVVRKKHVEAASQVPLEMFLNTWSLSRCYLVQIKYLVYVIFGAIIEAQNQIKLTS